MKDFDLNNFYNYFLSSNSHRFLIEINVRSHWDSSEIASLFYFTFISMRSHRRSQLRFHWDSYMGILFFFSKGDAPLINEITGNKKFHNVESIKGISASSKFQLLIENVASSLIDIYDTQTNVSLDKWILKKNLCFLKKIELKWKRFWIQLATHLGLGVQILSFNQRSTEYIS